MYRVIVVSLALLSVLNAAPADFEAGMEAYKRRDYATALKEWRPLAGKGHPEAQFMLGRIFARGGGGVSANPDEAVRWLQLAISNGHLGAHVGLGVSLVMGEISAADIAVEPLSPRDEFLWTLLLGPPFGGDIRRHVPEGLAFLRKAASQGDLLSAVWIGKIYSGNLPARERTSQIRALRLAGIQEDYGEALKWYQKAASGGSTWGQRELGLVYAEGLSVSQDYAEAMKWWLKAADKGDRPAMAEIGRLYYLGLGVPADPREAAMWYLRATDESTASSPLADLALGRLYESGQGVQQDYQQAARHYEHASLFMPIAQTLLGRLFLNGQGVGRDLERAATEFQSAADRGEALAQAELAQMYERGEFFKSDIPKALGWYQKAAEQGHRFAQLKLGVYYANGINVRQDYKEAVHWLLRAANQGSAMAQNELGVMSENGHGTPQDFVKAHMWYNLAAASGSSAAIENRAQLSGRMTSDQLARAQDLARNWHARGENNTEPFGVRGLTPRDGSLMLTGSGTGFVVAFPDYVLTNQHVVEGCRDLRTQVDGETRSLATLASDPVNDLALLRLAKDGGAAATFRSGQGPRSGETIVTVGYPLSGIVASSPAVTTGVISALAGPDNDARLMQITAPVQQGSSGSPVLDGSGNVVGVVVSKLDAVRLAELTGDVPQNVNFALKASVVQAFLEVSGIEFRSATSLAKIDTPVLAEQAQKYTLAIQCWK